MSLEYNFFDELGKVTLVTNDFKFRLIGLVEKKLDIYVFLVKTQELKGYFQQKTKYSFCFLVMKDIMMGIYLGAEEILLFISSSTDKGIVRGGWRLETWYSKVS